MCSSVLYKVPLSWASKNRNVSPTLHLGNYLSQSSSLGILSTNSAQKPALQCKEEGQKGKEGESGQRPSLPCHANRTLTTGPFGAVLGKHSTENAIDLLTYSPFPVLVSTDLGSIFRKESRALYSCRTHHRAPKMPSLLSYSTSRVGQDSCSGIKRKEFQDFRCNQEKLRH